MRLDHLYNIPKERKDVNNICADMCLNCMCDGHIKAKTDHEQMSGYMRDSDYMAVVWIILCLGVYRIRKTQIFPAAFQNNFVQMADAGFSAPFMNLPEIDFFFMTLQIKGKITEKADTESAVQIMLQHMMNHIESIFCRRQDCVSISVDVANALAILEANEHTIYDPPAVFDSNKSEMEDFTACIYMT